MIAAPSHRGYARERNNPVIVAAVTALLLVIGSTGLFLAGLYDALVYVAIAIFSVVAFAAPLRWGLASLICFAGVAGILKDIAAYAPIAHLGNDIVFGSLLIGYVARSATRMQPLLSDFPYRRVVGFLFIVALFCTFLPITHPLVALGGWKGYVLPALLVPIGYAAFQEKGSSYPVVAALLVTGIGNAVAGLTEQNLGPEVIGTWGPGFVHNIAAFTFAFDASNHVVWRPFGLSADAGGAAGLEAVAAAILVYLAFGRRQLLQVLAGAGALLCALAAVNSGVRTAVVMIIIGTVGAIIMRGARKRSSLFVGLLAVAVIGATLFFLLQGAPVVIQSRLGGLLTADTYSTQRGAVYVLIIDAFRKYPVGIGMGTVTPGAEILSGLAGVRVDAAASENMLLAMLYELGWFGAIFTFALLFSVGRVVKGYLTQATIDREGGLASIVLLTVLVSGFSSPVLIAEPANLIVWIFAALAAVRAEQYRAGRAGPAQPETG